jgi:hypothetical protein
MDPEIFFPGRGETTATAKAACAGCSVREECEGQGQREHHGIWGGLSERERRGRRREMALEGRPIPRLTASDTHCPHGHPWTEENTRLTPQGHRRCGTCGREATRRYMEERRSRGAA